MKKLIIAALLTACSTAALAEDYFMVHGKKIGLHDSRKAMITKLGKPKVDAKYTTWEWPDVGIMAEYDQYGLEHMTINVKDGKKTNNASVVIDGQTISLTKDTPKTIQSKVKELCSELLDDDLKMYRQSIRVGAEGEIALVFSADGNNAKTLINKPVDAVELTYKAPLYDPQCNY